MIELTGWTKYYAVELNNKEYTIIEEYDSNPDDTRYEVESIDGGEITQEEEEAVLKELREAEYEQRV